MRLIRPIFATSMLAGAYVIALAAAAIDVALVAAPIVTYFMWRHVFGLPALTGMLVGVTGSSLLAIFSGIIALRRIGDSWKAIALPEQDAAPLREVVDDLARKARTKRPERLYLTAVANAWVTERSGPHAVRRGTRSLYVGLPLIVGLSTSELRAILAHEVGHYAGKHPWSGALVHRGLIFLHAIRGALAFQRTIPLPRPRRRIWLPYVALVWMLMQAYVSLGFWVFSACDALYSAGYISIRRGQEYEADKIGAGIIGEPDELADALSRIAELASCWQDFHERFLEPMRAAGCFPDDPFEAFHDMLADSAREQVTRSRRSVPAERRPSPENYHPCLEDRLIRLRSLGARAEPGTAPELPASVLPDLQDRPWITHLCDMMLSPSESVDSLSWDACVNRVSHAHATVSARRLVHAVLSISSGERKLPGTSTLNIIISLVEMRRSELADAVAKAYRIPDADSLALLSRSLFALAGLCAVDTGRVRWAAGWDSGLRGGDLQLAGYELGDTTTERLRDRIASFVSASVPLGEASSITSHLLSLGVSLDAPVELMLDAASEPVTSAKAEQVATVMIRPGVYPKEQRINEVVRRVRQVVVAVGAVAIVGLGVNAFVTVAQEHSAAAVLPLSVATPWEYSPPAGEYAGYGLPSGPVLPSFVPPSCFPMLEAIPLPITVKRGDTLTGLAKLYGTTVAQLQRLNNLGSSTTIDAGQQLMVPLAPSGSCDQAPGPSPSP